MVADLAILTHALEQPAPSSPSLHEVVSELYNDRSTVRAIYLAVEGLRSAVAGMCRGVDEDDVAAIGDLVQLLEKRLGDRVDQVETLELAAKKA